MAYHYSRQPNDWDQQADISHEGSGFDLPPRPPVHRHPVGLHPDNQFQQNQSNSNNQSQSQSQRTYQDPNNYSDLSTPGAMPRPDDWSDRSVGSGINGIAPSAAPSANATANPHARPMGVPDPNANTTPFHDQYAYESPRGVYSQRSPGSNGNLAPGSHGPTGTYSSNSSIHSMHSSRTPTGMPYSDSPYNRYSSSAQNLAPQLGQINPNEVADDDDWGMGTATTPSKRRSLMPFGNSRDGSRQGSPGSSINGAAREGGAAGAAAGTGAYPVSRDGTTQYDAVPITAANQELIAEKSDWKNKDDLKKRKRRMWIAIAIITVLMLGAILGGVLGAFVNRGKTSEPKSSSGTSASDIIADNKDDLGKNSAEIKALMNNANLHKVFPGMDYTPLNAQYPDCLSVGPSQNNITRDMAVMSQLTNSVRTYGTDCNQTEMLIHAIDRLEIKSSMKLWLGVWIDSNTTTTNRQIAQTWKILDDYGCDYFKGIIIGNEVLFRKDLTATQLLTHITEFRKNITDHKCQLPVAMADLGDNWTADIASKVDYVMSNVHPFFAGVDVSVAAGWTWNFWQTHDVSLTSASPAIKQTIAEVGWPSAGGKNCGSSPTCGPSTPGSVAGITELNSFMQDWICPSLKNGTDYFWFSAFDEPWKIRYNEKGKEWEDKWGLMDINRNLKPGVKIPSCDGLSLPS